MRSVFVMFEGGDVDRLAYVGGTVDDRELNDLVPCSHAPIPRLSCIIKLRHRNGETRHLVTVHDSAGPRCVLMSSFYGERIGEVARVAFGPEAPDWY